jgi:hypothetical protein
VAAKTSGFTADGHKIALGVERLHDFLAIPRRIKG